MAQTVPGPVACESCDLGEICSILDRECDRLPRGRLRSLCAGEALHRVGTPSDCIYAARKGVLKSIRITTGSAARLRALHLPGEAFGMEAFTAASYVNEVVALTPVICCEVPLAAFDPYHLRRVPELELALMRLRDRLHVPNAIHLDRSLLQRVRAFFLGMALRLEKCGFKADRFLLGVTREELASLFDRRADSMRGVLKLLAQNGLVQLERNELGLALPARHRALSRASSARAKRARGEQA